MSPFPFWKIFGWSLVFLIVITACSEAFKNRKAKHAHTTFKNVTSRHHDKRTALPDLFTRDLQAKWLAKLGKTLCLDMSTSLTPQAASTAFDPKAVVQSLVDLLKEEPGIDSKYYEGIAKLKDDPDFERVTREFDEAVSGQRNMINIGKDLPEVQQAESQTILDVGLRGEVITGETSDKENDLIRYSTYISGAGSTFGGTMAAFPQTIKDLTEGAMAGISYQHDKLAYKLKNGITVDVLRQENADAMIRNNIQPEVELRLQRTGMDDIQDVVVSESFEKIKNLPGTGPDVDQTQLTQQNFNTQKKAGIQRGKLKSTKIGDKLASGIGFGVESATTGFTLAQGGIDVIAGNDVINRAKTLRESDSIGETEYNEMMRNGRLRVAQGTFGLASGMKNVVQFAGKRIEKNIIDTLGQAGTDTLDQLKRFGSVVGGVISVGTSITSMTKNAIAASDASKQGLTGKAIVYGVMAAVDGVTAILDGASVALDFVFPPLSAIVDLVSTVLQVINTILGFLADLVDWRTTAQRVRDEFAQYTSSKAFNDYIDNMEKTYKDRGFDIFTYYTDAEAAGINADTETLQAEKIKITRCLTTNAKEDFNNQDLRVALVCATSLGQTLTGRANDDEILAGFGPDEVYGKEGDDILFGRGGDDSIFGGPGHDYLNGGTGRDILLGGEGDDTLACEPAVDERCEGQEGRDVLQIAGPALIYKEFDSQKCFVIGPEWETHMQPKRTSPVKGIYLDIGYTSGSGSTAQKGRSGISLGSSFKGWPDGFIEFVHKPAFDTSPACNLQQKFLDFFNAKGPQSLSNAEELKNKMLWFMAETVDKKYFADGVSLYEVSTSTSSIRKANNAISGLNTGYAKLENDLLTANPADKKVEALLVFAFKKSFVFDDFVRFSAASPDNLEVLAHYIPTTMIGSDEDNTIDVSYSLGDMVFTGEGNNVVSVGSTLNWYRYTDLDVTGGSGQTSGFYKWAKYVVGGTGENTLVIQYMPPPGTSTEIRNYGRWVLRNTDSEFDGDIRYSHVLYLKNIQSVEVHAPPNDEQKNIYIDAKYYDGAERYILDRTTFFWGPLSTEKDVMVLPRRIKGTNTIEFGPNTKNTLSFKHYEDEEYKIREINIYQEFETNNGWVLPKSGQKIWVKHALNVISFSSCERIIGSKSANLIIAEGGQTTVEARDGDDTLVSARGRHILDGGSGADTYLVYGPTVTDYLTISVLMGEDGSTIRCSTTIYGEWKESEKQLHIDMLQDDHAEVLLNTVEIVPGEGEQAENLGTISKDSANRKLIFSPGSNFNDLHRNTAKVVRVKVTTKGSRATIKEEDFGNQLRFDSITSFDDLTPVIENNKLVFKDKSSPPKTVLIDEEWGRKLISGVTTNLFDLILDFAKRFSLVLFRKNDKEFDRITPKDLVEGLYEQLKHHETDLEQPFDTILDSTSLPSGTGQVINVGNGANVVLAKTRGKTYKLGDKSSGSFIVADKFTGGSGNVVVEGGTDRSSLNTLVVGVGSGGVVNNHLGPHTVIVTGATLDELQFKCENTLCIKDSQQNKLIDSWYDSNCKRLLFKKEGKTQIVVNGQGFLTEKSFGSRNAYPIIISHGTNLKLKLELPFQKDDAVIDFHNDFKGFLWIIFKNPNLRDFHFWRHPYLAIEAEERQSGQIDAQVVVNAVKTRFKSGLKFTGAGGDIPNNQICQFVIDASRRSRPRSFTIANIDDVSC